MNSNEFTCFARSSHSMYNPQPHPCKQVRLPIMLDFWCTTRDSNPQHLVPKKLKPIAKSSTFRIIFYHKISYQKSLNPFIFQHFRHFFLSNNTIQYFHLKIQHKHPVCKSLAFFLQKFVTF